MSSYILKAKLTSKTGLPIIDICDCTPAKRVDLLQNLPENQSLKKGETQKTVEVKKYKDCLSEQKMMKSRDVRLSFDLEDFKGSYIESKQKIKRKRKKVKSKPLHRLQSVVNHFEPLFSPTMISRFVNTGKKEGVLRIGVVYTIDTHLKRNNFSILTQSLLFNKKNDSMKNQRDEAKQMSELLYEAQHVQIVEKSGMGRRDIPIQFQVEYADYCIYDNVTLTNYCIKWCRDIFEKRAELLPIHGTETLILTIPQKENYFVQFAYGDSQISMVQQQFQLEVAPAQVHLFHTFHEFALFMKDKIQYDA